MTTTLLSESTAVATKAGNGRWRSVLITPGQGSSGYYSEDVLREYGPKVLRKGAKSFVTHNRMENGEPDPFAMWGFLAEDSYYEEGVGLVGTIEVLPSWRERVEEVAPHVALSVYICGELDENGNVSSLVEDVQNGVDLVAYPGRPGSALVEQMIESAIADSDKPGVTSAQEERKLEMEKDVEERFDALETLLTSLVAKETASQAEAVQAEADEKAVRAAVEAYHASITAIDAADLPEKVVESLRTQAMEGVDVAPLIEQAVEMKSALTANLAESASQGRDFGSGTETKFGAWK